MAIFATLAGALGRFAGKLLNAALGWASTLLFGRVSQDKQVLLLLITFGSVVWVVLVVGVVFPDVGTFLIGFVPVPDFVEESWVRLAMLIGALAVPLLVGVAASLIPPEKERPKGLALVKNVLRGYLLAVALAFVLVFLGVVGGVRKIRSLLKRWKDAHVPVVVREGGYDRMVEDLETAMDDAGLDVTRAAAPKVLSLPPKVVAAVAGGGVDALVPDRLIQLTGEGLEIQLYPSDIAIAGEDNRVVRARAAITSRLASTAAFLTTSAEAQKLEERLQHVADRERLDTEADRQLKIVDDELAHLDVPYEEWEVLYRERLQVERDLLTGRKPGAFPGEEPGSAGPVSGRGREAGGGKDRPPAFESLAAASLVGLLVLDIVLALRERGGR